MPAAGVRRCGFSQKGQEFSRKMPESIVYTGRFRRDVEIQTIGNRKLEFVLHPKICNEATSNLGICFIADLRMEHKFQFAISNSLDFNVPPEPPGIDDRSRHLS